MLTILNPPFLSVLISLNLSQSFSMLTIFNPPFLLFWVSVQYLMCVSPVPTSEPVCILLVLPAALLPQFYFDYRSSSYLDSCPTIGWISGLPSRGQSWVHQSSGLPTTIITFVLNLLGWFWVQTPLMRVRHLLLHFKKAGKDRLYPAILGHFRKIKDQEDSRQSFKKSSVRNSSGLQISLLCSFIFLLVFVIDKSK